MAQEIHIDYPSGNTLYFCIRNSTDQVWYIAGATFEAWGTGSRANNDYDYQCTDRSGSRYSGDFPSAVPVGNYSIQVFLQAGGSPAAADVIIGGQDGRWDGSGWTAADSWSYSDRSLTSPKSF